MGVLTGSGGHCRGTNSDNSGGPRWLLRGVWLHSAALGDRGWGSATTRSRMPPTRPGGARRTDRSGVGCSHRAGCPLFPLLNASLRGWRDHYCDSENRWHDCARYKLSLTGQLVPITLLPNGHDAQLLRPEPGESGASEPRRAPEQAPPSPETAVAMAQFEPAPAPEPARPLEPSPPAQVPQSAESPPSRLARPARQAHGSVRHRWTGLTGWWTRFADWMTGPA